MRSFVLVLFSIVITFLCWGSYGPVLHEGQYDLGGPMRPSSLRPFICVGVAYFLIAVVVPVAMLVSRGEKGRWTIGGAFWAVSAGIAGAVGALGIILAFKFRGNPVYVMPLVFGLAPVVNTFVTMTMTRSFRQASGLFYAAVIVVAVGAAGVLFFRPTAKNIEVEEGADGAITVQIMELSQGAEEITRWSAESLEELRSEDSLKRAYSLYLKKQPLSWSQKLLILASVCLTALCWGCYGPVLHKGQAEMQGSRLRPFLCVGLAYFAIAVLVPLPLLQVFQEPGSWNLSGITWSLAAGAAGAVGALGIILAFNFGGKPIFVMPLVFGGAPVVNTFITIIHEGTLGQVSVLFYTGLVMVVAGAVSVLVFAPRAGKTAAAGDKPAETTEPPEVPAADRIGTSPESEPEPVFDPDPDSGGFEDEEDEETFNPDETTGLR